MEKCVLIKSQLDKIGRQVYLTDGDWTSMPFNAGISHLWRKKSTAFEPDYTPLGAVTNSYYLYIGPYNHNICQLSDDAVLILDDEKYEFKCKDPVTFGPEVLYYTGILRKLKGDEDIDS